MKANYKLQAIKETGYSFNYDFDYTVLDPSEIKYYVARSFALGKKEDTLVVKVEVTVSYGEADILLTRSSAAVVFELHPIGSIISLNSDTGLLETHNKDIIDNMLQTSIGVLRGILYASTKGTPLEPYPLPLMAPAFFDD